MIPPYDEMTPEETNLWVEQQVERMKKQNEGYGPPFSDEDLERMRELWRSMAPRRRIVVKGGMDVVVGSPRVPPEKMHEEVLAGGWTCEAKKSFRRQNGEVYEVDFYWSPTRKLGGFLYQAWHIAKKGNIYGGEKV